MRDTQAAKGSQTSLREANRARVVGAVQQHGSLTQVELATITGLSPASVSNIVTELADAGVLDTSPSIRSGRRARLVTLARSIGMVAGIDLAARSMHVALADTSMQILASETLPLAPDHRADMSLQRAAMLVQEMVESVDAAGDELLAIGVGVPAPVEVATGTVSSTSLLRGWDGAAVTEILAATSSVPTVVDNDANLGALAEARYGAGVGADPVAYVRVSHRIGAGIVLGGRVLHGRRGTAGELGHMIVDERGPVCRCGNRGCLETVAGAAALVQILSASHGHLTLDDVITRALDGDPGCRRAIADTGRTLGTAIANLCTVVDPEIVVIGGDMSTAGEVLLGPLRDALEQHTLATNVGAPNVVPAEFGGEAELRGALAAALDRARELGALGVAS
ncbi:ROK family transcriptional regulator [Microbacterium xanthum]|uniref:ROK family transcriptional regulator n=1 Tax=Microbacterium xanthum TaxID=3079794 RepID=UPI002AD59758|nr:ROK family transcriptional regulator [Microbacterium sp. KSW-48]MDZ8171646.1 ROK family transcriptional regulator [Microbacterium sp. KSW-48]